MNTHIESGSVTNTVSDQASLGDTIELGLAPRRTWQENDLTAITGAPPAASASGFPGAADTPFAYVAPDGSGRVVYRDGSLDGTGDVIELRLEPGSVTWQWDDLTAITGAPQASWAPVALVTPGNVARVIYADSTGGITELWLPPGGTWQHDSPTALTGAPAPLGPPVAYLTPDNVTRVIYVDSAGDIIELRLEPGSGTWQQANLTAITGAPQPGLTPVALVTPDNVARVIYFNSTGGVTELRLEPGSGTWQQANLTAITGAPQPGSGLVAVIGPDGLARVYYAAGDIIELRLDQYPDGWVYSDLNISVSNSPAPQDAGSRPFAYVTPDGALRVVYRDGNLDILEMYLTSDAGTWQWDTLTAVPGAPPAASAPFAYVTPDNVARVYYSSLPS